MYGEGISRAGDILDCAVDANLIEKSGAWYSLNGQRIGQGRENAKEYLKTHPQEMDALEAAIKEKYIPKRDDTLVDDSENIKVDADGVIID